VRRTFLIEEICLHITAVFLSLGNRDRCYEYFQKFHAGFPSLNIVAVIASVTSHVGMEAALCKQLVLVQKVQRRSFVQDGEGSFR
jgi:hypothetical protein